MRTLRIITLHLCLIIGGFAPAAETFDLSLPEAAPAASSEGFVNSFQESSSHGSAAYGSAPAQRAPSSPPEEDEGSYSKAFTALSSKRSEEDATKEANEKWQQSQQEAPVEIVDLEDSPSRGPSAASAESSSSQAMDLNKELESLSASTSSSGATSSSSFDHSDASISGKTRRDLILRTISENYQDLKYCYREGLKRNSQMKGKVVMGWAMDPQGRVLGAEVQTSQLKNKQVEKCMVDRLSGWRFPRQAKAQSTKDRMIYTFQFVPESE